MTNLSVPLQVGQRVKLQDTEQGYILNVLAGDQPGDTIVTVGADFLMLEDAGAEVQLRIPTFLIRSVTGLPESPAQPEFKPQSVSHPKPEAEPEFEPEPESLPRLISEPEPEIQLQPEFEPEPESLPQLVSEPEPESQTQAA